MCRKGATMELQIGDTVECDGVQCVINIENFDFGQYVKLSPSGDWVSSGRVKILSNETFKSVDTGTNTNTNTNVDGHYKKAAMQPIEVMQAVMTQEQFEGFLLGNIIKYRMRMDFKGQKEEDRRKANLYAYWLLQVRNGLKIDLTASNNEYIGI